MSEAPHILIVGAGPVGLAAAVELHRRGFSFRIIDRSAGPRTQSRALAVQPTTLTMMEPSGLTERFLEAGNKIRRMKIYAEDSQLTSLELSNLGHRYSFLLSLPQSQTEHLFIDWLAERGIAVEWNCSLTSLNIANGTAQVELLHEGRTHNESFGLVLGADGSRSAVREAAGIGFAGDRMEEEFSLIDVRPPGGVDPHEAIARITEHGILGAIPLDEKTIRYVADGPDIEARLPEDARGGDTIWQSTFHISYHVAETFAKPPVYLAGDAAHIHSPVGGRGMNLGIEDACWFAWLLEQDRLDEYSATRKEAAEGVVGLTRGLTDTITSRNPFVRFAFKSLLRVAFSLAPVQKMALRRLTGAGTAPAPWL
ncbi:FAD-dependent oxidoreductase [Tepidamorphus sp. 3E244]|uniref:FAD-dependent oxidoreductase n=1 Tax=Tepidamorphus sp. 3E244 TaxID=3385498 RepID=UPI0038FCA0CF